MRAPDPITLEDGLVLVEHEVDVPLDHAAPEGPTISVFAREVAAPDGRDRPFLVFLQGGPGHEGPRPTQRPLSPGWLERALVDHRVLLVDGRGTGRSAPIGDLSGLPAAEQADHLALFRADAIVADTERLREALGVEQWSVLGQSFGGFCILHYLSVAPGSLTAAYVTGGVPPVGRPVDDVYARTYPTMLARNRAYRERYPGDRARIQRVQEMCAGGEIALPNGDLVTPRRIRHVGSVLGMSYGAESVHALFELDPRSRAFRHDLAAALPFSGRDPIYAALQESCYADGTSTGWAAERLMPEEFLEDPALLLGEHVLPSTFADDSELTPLAEAADLLAHRSWPRLYDEEALRSCVVPAAAAIYTHDAYVDRELSEETAAMVPTMRTWVTPDHEHNALRTEGGEVLDRLFALVRGH